MRIWHLILVTVLCLSTSPLSAEDCNTDCHEQCGFKVFGKRIVEPTCHAKCEAAKKTSCAIGVRIPSIPVTTVENVKATLQQSCIAAYQALTNAVIGECSNYDGRLDGQPQIARAAQMLISNGFVRADELAGVQIRYCPLRGAQGMAPDRGRIYLHTSTMNDPPIPQAALLAHEVKHLRQYRTMGTDNFKCTYSRKYVECGGCQDDRHPLEAEAYQFERAVMQELLLRAGAIPAPIPGTIPAPPARQCFTNFGACWLPGPQPSGSPCSCQGYGRIDPGTAR